jgi:hypothetical protein
MRLEKRVCSLNDKMAASKLPAQTPQIMKNQFVTLINMSQLEVSDLRIVITRHTISS